MSESNQQHEGERGNTVDQVAELLLADEPTVDELSLIHISEPTRRS